MNKNEEIPLDLEQKQSIVEDKINSLMINFRRLNEKEILLIKGIRNSLYDMTFHTIEDIVNHILGDVSDNKSTSVLDIYNMLEFLRDRRIVEYTGTYANGVKLNFDKY